MYKRGKSRKKISLLSKLIIFICIVAIIIFSVFLFVQSRVNPILVSIAEAKVKSMTASAINNAIFSCFDESLNYSDLVEVVFDNDGKITMLQANAVKLNEISRRIARKSEENLNNMYISGISVPAGTLTGSATLSPYGWQVNIEIMTMGAVVCKFNSEFESAGINQTRHKIFLEVSTNVSLVIPISKADMKTTNRILMCESVLVGDVPNVYMDFGNGGGTLDLIP